MTRVWLDRGECPDCGSSDGKVEHREGHSYCFVCNTRFGESKTQEQRIVKMSETSPIVKTTGLLSDIPDRKISRDTAKKYGTQIKKTDNVVTHHIYQYYDKDGNHVANKVREVQGKKFWSELIQSRWKVYYCMRR